MTVSQDTYTLDLSKSPDVPGENWKALRTDIFFLFIGSDKLPHTEYLHTLFCLLFVQSAHMGAVKTPGLARDEHRFTIRVFFEGCVFVAAACSEKQTQNFAMRLN